MQSGVWSNVMKGNDNVLFLALGILVDFVVVAGVVAMTKDNFPRFAKWAKVIAGAPIVAMLFVGYFWGTPNPASFGDRVTAFLPHLGIALWAMLVLHLAMQSQVNERRSEKLATKLDDCIKQLGEQMDIRISEIDASLRKTVDVVDHAQSSRVDSAREEFSGSLMEVREDVRTLQQKIAWASKELETLSHGLIETLGKPRIEANKQGKITRIRKARYANIEDLSEALVELRRDLKEANIHLTPDDDEESDG
jgi:hypothetical protein